MHLTWRSGSPDSQLDFWLMMVSMAMAVLPVCRSPMISSRWPRPIGVIASIALMPVCSGWLTLARWTTEGACSSSARRTVPSISPLPSSGTPSGSTTRPRKPSPTGTESTSPVRRTCWPSSTLVKSPRMTTPISRTSRLSARPRIPPGNSSSSLAIAEGRPSTCAMPSPASVTTPTSCREAPSGSYAWTKLASASRISSGRIVSSAMVLASFSLECRLSARQLPRGPRPGCAPRRSGCAPPSGRQLLSKLGEPARHAAVNELIPDLDGYSTHDPGIDNDIQVNIVAVGVRQGGGEPPALIFGEPGGDPHDGDQALPPGGGHPPVLVQRRLQVTSSRVDHRLGDQAERGRAHLGRQQRVQQAALALLRSLIFQGRPQGRLGTEDPAEPEQLILQVIELAFALGRGRGGQHGELLDRVGQVPRRGPAAVRHARDQVHGGRGDAAVQQPPDQAAPGRGRAGGVGQRPAHPQLLVEQVGHLEQLLAEHRGVGSVRQRGGQLLARHYERSAAGAPHRSASRGRPVTALASVRRLVIGWRFRPAGPARPGSAQRRAAAWPRRSVTRPPHGWRDPPRARRPRP